MLKKLRVAFILLSLPSLSSANAPAADTFDTAAQIIQFFDEAPEVVWPGFRFSSQPTIVHRGTPELLAFDFEPATSRWMPVNDLAHPAWLTFQDTEGLHQMPLHPSYSIEGQMAYVFNLNLYNDPSKQARAYQAFVHERFHFFQFKTFQLAHTTAYRDHLNTDVQTLLYIENKTLMALLNDLSSVEKMKDYVAVYQTRRPFMHPDSWAWEQWQTRVEGMAEYVDVKTFLALPILDTSPLALLDFYTHRNFGWGEEMDVIDSSVKWRYYSVGAITGLALDELAVPKWKEQVSAGASPSDVLSDYFNLSAREIDKRFKRISKQYADPALEQHIKDSVTQYQAHITEIDTQYQNTPGTEIQWSVFSCTSGGSGDNGFYLPNGNTVIQNYITTKNCQQADQQYLLNMKKHPILYSSPVTRDRFKISPNSVIEMDGVAVQSNTLPSSGSFHTLNIKDDTVTISYTGKGCYEAEPGHIVFLDCAEME